MTNLVFLYDNRLADTAPVASSTADGDVLNVLDFRPYTFWQPSSIPATITVNSGIGAQADYAAFYGHNLFTNGCTVQIRASTDNFVSSDVAIASHTPTDDLPFLITFNLATYQYWRVRIANGSSPSLGIVTLGKMLELPVGLQQGFDPLGRKAKGIVNSNMNGYPLGSVIEFEQLDQMINVPLLPWSWLRDSWMPAWRSHLKDKPFIIGWNIDEYPDEISLVTSEGRFDSSHQVGGWATLNLSVSGVFEE